MVQYQDQELTHKIIGAAILVHKNLGPGLLETAYRFCLGLEFEALGLNFKQEVAFPLIYRNRKLDCGFRADFLVEEKVVLELKSLEILLPIHESQLLTYLRLMNKQVGLLINFNETTLKNGIRRCVLKATETVNTSLTPGRVP